MIRTINLVLFALLAMLIFNYVAMILASLLIVSKTYVVYYYITLAKIYQSYLFLKYCVFSKFFFIFFS